MAPWRPSTRPPHVGSTVPPPDDHPDDLWAVGADPGRRRSSAAYRLGLFPCPSGHGSAGSHRCGAGSVAGWTWPLAAGGAARATPLRRSGSTRRSRQLSLAARDRDPTSWIDARITRAYARLHALGWAHSVEAWDDEGLAGGLVAGVAIGGLFAAESMFHARNDASKAAFHALVEPLRKRATPTAASSTSSG